MPPNTPPSPPPGPQAPLPPPIRKKKPLLLYGCGVLVALLLVIVATVVITVWWIQRPIRPVVLSAKEKAAVDAKLQQLDRENNAGSEPARATKSKTLSSENAGAAAGNPTEEHAYVPGSKTVKLTDREVNGLLNANTDLGKSVRLEFARDAVNAYVAVPIPQDFPVLGGKMFRARGQFRVSLGNGGEPYAILEDVTVFGLSLPKAWVGGIKGENLLSDAVRKSNGRPLLRGIKSLRVEPGELVLEVED